MMSGRAGDPCSRIRAVAHASPAVLPASAIERSKSDRPVESAMASAGKEIPVTDGFYIVLVLLLILFAVGSIAAVRARSRRSRRKAGQGAPRRR